MNARWRERAGLVALALFALIAAPLAQAQTQFGNIFGTVADEQGEPLPGTRVTVAGIGAPQVQFADERGSFRFLNLSPGSYSLNADLDGFSPVELPSVVVELGRNTQIQVKLTSAIIETITVTSEAALVDERATTRGTSLSASQLDSVPTARDPWSLLTLAPGVQVDRINVGGNESGQQSAFLGPGSAGTENVFAVDGVVLTDMAAVGASATYFDFGAFEEVQLTVSGADVTVATAGVTVNQVTKRGTNDWRFEGRYLRTDGDLQSEPSVVNGNKIDSVEEYGANIGGPLVRDRLWIWGSYGESDINNLAPAPTGSGRLLDRTQLEDFNTKLNFQATPRTSGVLHYWTNDKLKFGRVFTFLGNPVAEATHNQTTPSDIYKVEVTQLFGSDLVVTGLYSRDDGAFTLSPKGGLDVDVFTDGDNILHGSSFDFAQDAVIDQGRIDANYHVSTDNSNHDLKFGIGFREQENSSTTSWPRGKNVFFLDGELALVRFNRNRALAVKTNYDSAWLQDTISLDRWTITAGLRYDKQNGENLASVSPANPQAQGLIPELAFPGNDAGGFEWETIVPRLSVTYALGENRETLARATFSQYSQQLSQGRISFVNPAGGYSYAYFYFTDANGNLVLDPTETDSLYFGYTSNINADDPTSLISVNVNDPNLDPAITDEITLGLEHSFSGDFAAGFTATWRNTSDIIESRGLVVDPSGTTRPWTRNDFELKGTAGGDQGVTLPNGEVRHVPVYGLKDGIDPVFGSFVTNGDSEHEYLGVSANFVKRLNNRWSARGHVTFSDWDWSIGPDSLLHDDPTNTTGDGLTAGGDGDIYSESSNGAKSDVFVGSRWSFNLNGLYQVAPDKPWGFNVAASITGREGYSNPPVFRQGRGSLGRVLVELSDSVDEFRHDDVITLDGRVEKEFHTGDLTWLLGIDGFNLLNEDYVLQRDRRFDLGSSDNVRERISPRVFRVGLTLRYR
jgi:hypothetical protein